MNTVFSVRANKNNVYRNSCTNVAFTPTFSYFLCQLLTWLSFDSFDRRFVCRLFLNRVPYVARQGKNEMNDTKKKLNPFNIKNKYTWFVQLSFYPQRRKFMRKLSISFVLILFSFMVLFAVHPAGAETNLIKNGDFSQGLENWYTFIWNQVGEAPHIAISEDFSNPCLYIDTPTGSSAFVYQAFDFPDTLFAELRFRVCGGMDSVRVRVYIENTTDPIDQWKPIDEFDPAGKRSLGGVFTTKWYNVTEYAGTEAMLVFWADSPNNEGTAACVLIDDVAVNIVTETSSTITCCTYPIPTTLGKNVTVMGSIHPSSDGNVTLTYSRPNGSTVIRNVTAYEGDYEDVFVADTTGIWTVFASWNGSAPYEGATSLPTPFIISPIWILNVTDNMVMINDVLVNLEDGIEALPAEELLGSITVTSSVSRRPELDQLVVFNTWESDRWDLLLFYLGTVSDVYGEGMDPFGVKDILAIPFRVFESSLDTEKGAFVVDYGYQFPMLPDAGNDLYGSNVILAAYHPTFKAPVRNGTYYIVFYFASQRSARECVYPVDKEFDAFPNQTVNSVWDLNPTCWENVTLEKRDVNCHNIFAIPVYVIEGVDETINGAQNIIDDLENNHLPWNHAEGNLSLANSEYKQRHFSLAKKYAQYALDTANETLSNYHDDVEKKLQAVKSERDKLEHFKFGVWAVAEVSGLNRNLEQAEMDFDSGNYLKAKQLLGQIEDDISRTFRSAKMIMAIAAIILCSTLIYGVFDAITKLPNVTHYLFRYVVLAAAIGALWQLLSISGIFTIEFFIVILMILFLSVITATLGHYGTKRKLTRAKSSINAS